MKSKPIDLATLLNNWRTQAYAFLIFVFCPSQIKKILYNSAGQQLFNAPCKRVTSSLQKRKWHKLFTRLSKIQKYYFYFSRTLQTCFIWQKRFSILFSRNASSHRTDRILTESHVSSLHTIGWILTWTMLCLAFYTTRVSSLMNAFLWEWLLEISINVNKLFMVYFVYVRTCSVVVACLFPSSAIFIQHWVVSCLFLCRLIFFFFLYWCCCYIFVYSSILYLFLELLLIILRTPFSFS